MKFTRRQFLTVAAFSGAASCARVNMPRAGGLIGKDTFSFATVNDLFLDEARSTGPINRAVRDINARKDVAFTVALGNLARHGRFEQLKLASLPFKTLEEPFYAAPGESDIDRSRNRDLSGFTSVFNERYWKRRHGEWVLIGLDTTSNGQNIGVVDDEQLAWLEDELSGVGAGRPIAVFAHHPFNPGLSEYRCKNADAVLERFADYNLRLAAGGSYRGNTEEERDGVLYTTTVACSNTVDNHTASGTRGYRIFHVDHETLITEVVDVRVDASTA